MADQVADHVETAKNVALISSVLFVVRLAGLIDLLQHLKNLSLVMQTVNTLPWEAEEAISSMCALLQQLSADLKNGDVTRTLDPTDRSEGKRVPVFEFLSTNMANFKACKLCLRDRSHSQFSSPCDARVECAGCISYHGTAASAVLGGDDPETNAEIDAALLDLSNVAALMAVILSRRLADPDVEMRKIMCMARCLDLRKMAFDDGYAIPEPKPKEPLRLLYDWL